MYRSKTCKPMCYKTDISLRVIELQHWQVASLRSESYLCHEWPQLLGRLVTPFRDLCEPVVNSICIRVHRTIIIGPTSIASTSTIPSFRSTTLSNFVGTPPFGILDGYFIRNSPSLKFQGEKCFSSFE